MQCHWSGRIHQMSVLKTQEKEVEIIYIKSWQLSSCIQQSFLQNVLNIFILNNDQIKSF